MRLLVLPLAACLAASGLLLAQPQPPASKPEVKSALDKSVMEQYVRHLFVWSPQIQVQVGDPKPSPLPGFKEVTVVASYQQATQAETF
jgi:hypothetical protein